MQINTNYINFVLLILLSVLASCDDMESVVPDSSTVNTEEIGGLYILCDGNYSLNNSTLAVYDYKTNALNTSFFLTKNGRNLGDTGNEIQHYGSKLYIVVNVSSQIEVIDACTGLSIRQIPMFDGTKARQPRYITFWEDKAYVCSFDGTVARIDTSSLEVEAYVKVGRNPDGITYSNNKLYVSNSGGLDYATTLGYDNTVSVIDIETFTEISRIKVGSNPYRIKSDDYGYVYVACRGNYEDEEAVWVCINSSTDQVVETYKLEVMNFDIYGDYAYLYNYNSTTGDSWIKTFNLLTRSVERESFITDGTSISTPYGINVDPENGDVFITDAGNYISSGHVYCFDDEGRLKYKINNVGVSPNSVIHVRNFNGNGESDADTVSANALYIDKVLDYSPAPGQFVGSYPLYGDGDNSETMRVKAETLLKGKKSGLVTLGRYGGSLTFAFKDAVRNIAGSSDFIIYGNAFSNGAEPGIVEVSADVNNNALADDIWYELAGSEYSSAKTIHQYRICYYKPKDLNDSVAYKDNLGGKGFVNAYYPAWQGDSIVYSGSLLPPTATQNPTTGYWILNSLDWGYADNKQNTSEQSNFDIDWAVDATGQPVKLDSIHFIRVYTGVNQNAGWVGELSTEITGAEMFR